VLHSINLAILEDVARQLERLAEREFRRPRDEAALLLVQAVRRAALDLSLRSEEDAESSVVRPDRARPGSDTAVGTDALDGAG
jgi:hypothetical protein